MQDTIVERLRAIRERLTAVVDSAISGRPPDLAIPEPPIDDRHPIYWLSHRLHLTTTEERLVWILIAHELCPRARKLVRSLNTEDELDPTLDTLRRIVYGTAASNLAWRELGPDGALWRLGLLEWIDDASSVAAHRRTLRVASRILALAHGIVELDDELAGCATLDVPVVEIEDLEIAPEVVRRIDGALETGSGPLILQGGTGTGRRSILAALARRRDLSLLLVDGRALPAERERARRQLRLIARECSLLQTIPLITNFDALEASDDLVDRLDLVETELTGPVLAIANRCPRRRWRSAPVVIEVPFLDGNARARLWARALPEASQGDAELLATMYPLAPALVDAVGRVARREAEGVDMRPTHIETGIRSVLDDRLAGLAARVTITQTWEDLVLPDEQTAAVVELLARARCRRRVYEDWGFANKVGRGLGITALFSGPPGTGKTMCAGLVARDLGTELYQVDLGKITSKWIGETEKNLGALFDAAEAGCAVLLFDEADALFGKRTAVRSSNDQHANQKINFLLQRLENFAGICILTTNHDAALDEAFRRRLSVHVRFPMPDVEERARLWRATIPPRAPVECDLPISELAKKYPMTGGHIRNAVLRAAFLAADEDRPIGAQHLTQAAQLEFEAIGRIAFAA